jgi:Icc-related predicted phosphoesterase
LKKDTDINRIPNTTEIFLTIHEMPESLNMVILGLSDIHGDLSKINKIAASVSASDLILLVGDITHFGREEEAGTILGVIKNLNPHILAVSGNCDFPQVEYYLEHEGISIHRSGKLINGIGFIGAGGSLTTPFNTPNEMSEEALSSCLDEAISNLPPDIPFILVSHQPPFNTCCDRIHSGEHVGSQSLRIFIEKHQPLICFTGHIHESIGIDTIGKTKIINPGQFSLKGYAVAELDMDSDDPVQELSVQTV